MDDLKEGLYTSYKIERGSETLCAVFQRAFGPEKSDTYSEITLTKRIAKLKTAGLDSSLSQQALVEMKAQKSMMGYRR